jgi:GDP-mannose 6-dehydrogenase
MKIAVFGLGYVGTTTAACLASQGHEIAGVDSNEEKVEAINAGLSPITEPGLDQLVADAVKTGSLIAAVDAADHLDSCAMAIVCVGTPSAVDGSHDMRYIANVSRQIALLTSKPRQTPLTVVYRSTIRPGTIEQLVRPEFELILGQNIGNVEVVYNPEFLRESVAIDDFFNPPKIVIGTHDGLPCKTLDQVNQGLNAPVFYTTYREAEITKFVDNTFHAVKIAFANEIGRVCSRLGVGVKKVHEIFISDTKLNISPYYFRPGGAFGGSCLPKDIRALQHISGDVGAHTHLIDSLLKTNDTHKHFLFDLCNSRLKPNAKVLMIGIAFKPNSDDLRESPKIDLARRLLQAGHELSVFDPHIDPAKLLGQNLGYAISNLPSLRRLLISKDEMESTAYDLVIDTCGWADRFSLGQSPVVDVNTLA